MNMNLIILLAVLLSIPYFCRTDIDKVPLLVFLAILLIFIKAKETFAMYDVADIPEGNYMIQTLNGRKLMSTAVTPILCDDFTFGNSALLPSRKEDGWKLKKVTKGVYMFFKPTIEECLYVGNGNELKSFAPIGCPKKNLCGLENLNYQGELDNQNDFRTYFRIVNTDNGFYIISNHNNKYICINESGIGLIDTPTENCIFKFDKF
jgi:hypothetical protein